LIDNTWSEFERVLTKCYIKKSLWLVESGLISERIYLSKFGQIFLDDP